jgi:hypothetical protein
MKKSSWRALIGTAVLSLASLSTAHAALATFDDVDGPFNMYFDEPFTSGGLNFTTVGLGVIDTAEAFTDFGNAPTNATSKFFAALNDGGLTLAVGSSERFYVNSFDFAFISAVGGAYAPGSTPAALIAFYETIGGYQSYLSFLFSPADDSGLFAFSSIGAGSLGLLAGEALRSITFAACVFVGDDCFLGGTNQGQFALDNLDVDVRATVVPEPGSLALFGLGLVLMAGASRRRITR